MEKKTYLPPNQNRHHNLTPTTRIARNMTREVQHVRHNQRLLRRRRRAADAFSEADLLARGTALEGTEHEDVGFGFGFGGGGGRGS